MIRKAIWLESINIRDKSDLNVLVLTWANSESEKDSKSDSDNLKLDLKHRDDQKLENNLKLEVVKSNPRGFKS